MTDAPAPVVTPAVEPAPTGQNVPPPQHAKSNQEPTTQAPQAPAKEEKAPEPKPELFEVKINGKVVRMTKEQLMRDAQLGRSATERFEQAAQKEKRAQSIIESAQKNPMAALIELGLTKEQLRAKMEEWYTQEYIDPETLTEEQRELKTLKAFKAQKEAEEAERAQQTRTQQEEEEVKNHRELIQKQITEAMEANKLPKTKFTVSRIAFYMRQAHAKGYEAPMDLIIQQVKQERAGLVSDVPEDADYDTLVDMYGEGVVKKIVSEHLKYMRARRQSNAPGEFVAQKEAETSKSRISMREAEENLKRLMGRN